jgi:hypothetical protein
MTLKVNYNLKYKNMKNYINEKASIVLKNSVEIYESILFIREHQILMKKKIS